VTRSVTTTAGHRHEATPGAKTPGAKTSSACPAVPGPDRGRQGLLQRRSSSPGPAARATGSRQRGLLPMQMGAWRPSWSALIMPAVNHFGIGGIRPPALADWIGSRAGLTEFKRAALVADGCFQRRSAFAGQFLRRSSTRGIGVRRQPSTDARTSSIVGGYLSSKNWLIDIGDRFEPSDAAASRALFHHVQPSRMERRDETLRDHAGH
jgi:hypothetical protein